METQGGLAANPPAQGADPPAGPHGNLRGADAWDWHRRVGRMDARHTCPWCAPGEDCAHPASRRRLDDVLDALIARIEAMLSEGRLPEAHWPGAQGQWPALAAPAALASPPLPAL